MSRPANLEGLQWPEGEPGPLRSAAGRLRGLAGGFEGAGTRLSGAVPPAWTGVGSTSYSSTLTRGQDAVTHLAGSIDAAAAAYGELADAIESAQDDVRRAADRLHDAREAARQARARATEARWEADQAQASAALSPALVTGGAFDPLAADASAAEGRAQAAESDAATAEGEATRVETWAHGVADRAVSRVERADAACAGALDGTGMTGLVLGGGAVVSGAKAVWDFVYEVQVKPLNPWHSGYNEGESATVVGSWGSGIMFGTAEWTSRYAAQNHMKTLPGYWIREPRYVQPYTRSTPSGGTTRVSGYPRPGVWADSRQVPDMAARAKWATRTKWFTRAGGAAAFATAGLGQYFDDLDNPNLNNSERAGRIGMQTVTVGGAGAIGAWGGAAAGAAIGTAICPVVGTAVGGVIGGIVGGGLAGGLADKFNDGAVEWAGNVVDSIDMPDIDMPDIDMPDIDLPDVDLTPW